MISRLQSLPDELLDDVFMRLDRAEQYKIALASWHCYHRVVPRLYRAIELVDYRNEVTGDEHDDTPIIRILLVLAKNAYLASKVHDLTHRCHVPVPEPFMDLPCASLQDSNISSDGRTLKVISRAIHNLVNVNTLRIIYGHQNITIGLLEGFFSRARNHQHPVARLWLESCCLEGLFQRAGVTALREGLHSVRIRRLRAKTEMSTIGETVVCVRDRMRTVRFFMSKEWRPLSPVDENSILRTSEKNSTLAARLDEVIYQRFPGVEGLVEPQDEVDHSVGDPTCQDRPYVIDEEPAWLVSQLVTTSSSTLTSLNLDWVLDVMPLINNDWITHATFPNLRAFQVRNAVTTETAFHQDTTISLLRGDWLQFLERHPQIQCLAWPLEHFFHPTSPPHLTSRAQDVVMTLGRTLKELRIDAEILFGAEPVTHQIDPENAEDWASRSSALRRRFFIEHIAPHLSTLEDLKIEGSIPFDERSEIVRAVRFSPLRKLVVIGVAFPPLDTFVQLPVAVRQALFQKMLTIRERHGGDSLDLLEVKDWDTLQAEASSSCSSFVPTYNPSKYTLLDTIALYHASTITTLKFCGFRGAPEIHRPECVKSTLLNPLRHLRNLRHLSMSFWINTEFEGSARDDQIRSYWLDAQSPDSTALAMPAGAEDQNSWAKLLSDNYAPAKLVEKVAEMLTPRLSKQALAWKGGMSVKALLLLSGHEIFDLDVQLGTHGEVLSYRGPKSENDAEKIKEKMEGRAWF